jgi:hypothetical protein
MSQAEPAVPSPIAEPRLLIGEGVEEVLFFTAMLRHLEISGVQVEQYSGKEKLAPYLRTLTVRPGFSQLRVLHITRDADNSPQDALASVADAVQGAGFPSSIVVRTFLLPGAGRPGALEDLCLKAIAGQPIEQCIDDYFGCVRRVTPVRVTSATRQAKARIHAWLAAQEEPDLRLGQAAAKRYIEWSAPAFEELKDFLRGLVG